MCLCNLWQISFSAKEIDVAEWKGDIIAVGVTEKDMAKDGSKKFENSLSKNLDAKLVGHLSEASSEEDFTGKPGQSLVLRLPGLGSKRIDLIGLGQSATNTYTFRNFGEAIAATAKTAQASKLALHLPRLEVSQMNQSLVLLRQWHLVLMLGIDGIVTIDCV
ncbi:unnamed protein product [Dovyalis caffra]|uniref:Peptidase M17 leucyl aminopeptidase N-terminal domain-containing protein n=1 Tax=Dovyalis caffra TaxID=77055 RepID=A0AAV1SPR7_9ROSI|nr:unnamed protein product [Dovyalis caffra]